MTEWTNEQTILFYTYSLTQHSCHAYHTILSLYISLLSVFVCWQGDAANQESCGNDREWFLLSILHLLLTCPDSSENFLSLYISPMRMEHVKCKKSFILILNGKWGYMNKWYLCLHQHCCKPLLWLLVSAPPFLI